ncbi:MAG: hypothetical protein LBQ11_01440 [Candidatus Nomurabacteria bacterium]|jgi:hypothetical protein|nr:hypothetical protein [Candidatus Nomurabacteria bacterium]
MQDDMGGTGDTSEPKKTVSNIKALNISWSASESIDHERNIGWYIVAIVVVLALIGLNLWLQGINFGSISFAALILVIFVALLTVSHRPARELHYTLTDEGVSIEEQLHPFNEFRAFGVHHDGTLWQLVLIPVKRFSFSITIFIHDDQGEAIVDALGTRLPMENVKTDWLDKIVNKLKM